MGRLTAALLLMFTVSAGCYHATITTGATPSTQTIDKSFASSWIFGLVPPSTVATAAECPDGVAKVETQISFVNGLVGILTLGIYTPMSIKVTCAAKSTALGRAESSTLFVARESGDEAILDTFARAAEEAARHQKAVFVQVTD